MTHKPISSLRTVFSLPVIVASLGYFVDIYDLVLFSIVRVPSLKSLGLSGQELIDTGVFLLNMQMAGMLLGGIIWGVLGDRKGRLRIMFGAICLAAGFAALVSLEETFHKDLVYFEEFL